MLWSVLILTSQKTFCNWKQKKDETYNILLLESQENKQISEGSSSHVLEITEIRLWYNGIREMFFISWFHKISF